MAKTGKRESVFVSYASRDRIDVDRILKGLKTQGILGEGDEIIDSAKVFIPGSSLRGMLRRAIQSASKVVVVWSGEGAGSQWVNYEMGMADALGKPIIVVVPKGEAHSLPSELRDVRVVEMQHDG